ncbi:MAG: DUF6263 family protein [Flavobacteriaceae bacterium]|nr:DUF6263 family protein [Flavobacteriaceae bacterium]
MIRRILAIGGIGMALMACNKDKKSTQKTNTEPQKEEKTEVVEKPQPKAIADSAGIYTQKFILEKGKTYPFPSTQKQKQSLKAHTGETMSETQETVDERNIVVNDFENGVYDLTLNIISKKTSIVSNGKTIIIDTKKPAPKEQELKNAWTIDSTLAGSSFGIKMKENGEIISISGIEEIYKKMETAVKPLIKDANQRKQFIEYFKQGFNENVLKNEFAKGINILPKKGVKIGESWTETENIDEAGKIKSTITYTLTKVENGIAEISIKGGIPKKSDKKTQNGITATISIEGTQNGSIQIDENTGWILNSKLNIKTINKQSMTDGKITESVTSTSENNISIN